VRIATLAWITIINALARTCVCEDLLREVVDELPVDEAVDAVVDDLLALLAHLVLLCGLNLANLAAAAAAAAAAHAQVSCVSHQLTRSAFRRLLASASIVSSSQDCGACSVGAHAHTCAAIRHPCVNSDNAACNPQHTRRPQRANPSNN
jgi:hypothetical protein